MMTKGTIIPSLIWVAAIVGYISVMFLIYARDTFAEWLATLLATFIGAILAVAGGVVLLNIQRRQSDDDRRNQLLTALASEVRASQRILCGRPTPIEHWVTRKEVGRVVLVPLPHVVVEEAARRALFPSEKTDDFFNLAGKIQVHNKR